MRAEDINISIEPTPRSSQKSRALSRCGTFLGAQERVVVNVADQQIIIETSGGGPSNEADSGRAGGLSGLRSNARPFRAWAYSAPMRLRRLVPWLWLTPVGAIFIPFFCDSIARHRP